MADLASRHKSTRCSYFSAIIEKGALKIHSSFAGLEMLLFAANNLRMFR